MKVLINIKNNDNKCFLWCHILEELQKANKNMVNDLDYESISFPLSERNYFKIQRKNNICVYVFCYEDELIYPIYV